MDKRGRNKKKDKAHALIWKEKASSLLFDFFVVCKMIVFPTLGVEQILYLHISPK